MTRIEKIWCAVMHVRRARDLLREATCPLAADTLARALKSVEGAHRHAKAHEKTPPRACYLHLDSVSPPSLDLTR